MIPAVAYRNSERMRRDKDFSTDPAAYPGAFDGISVPCPAMRNGAIMPGSVVALDTMPAHGRAAAILLPEACREGRCLRRRDATRLPFPPHAPFDRPAPPARKRDRAHGMEADRDVWRVPWRELPTGLNSVLQQRRARPAQGVERAGTT